MVAALWLSVIVSACGFQPLYKMTNAGGSAVPLYALSVPQSAQGRALAAALRGRWHKRADAAFDVTIMIEENARRTQVDEDGVERRIELDYVLRVMLRRRQPSRDDALGDDAPGDAKTTFGQSKSFVLRHRESMARSDSGAADLTQRRDLARRAMQLLAERLVLRLSQEMTKDVAQEVTQEATP